MREALEKGGGGYKNLEAVVLIVFVDLPKE